MQYTYVYIFLNYRLYNYNNLGNCTLESIKLLNQGILICLFLFKIVVTTLLNITKVH